MVARGQCMVAWGWGCAWLMGACVVAGGCGWLLGGMHGCWGACMVAGGHAWWGACMVVGGMHGCEGMCGCQGGMCGIRRDTVNERAVRILLECILVIQFKMIIIISFSNHILYTQMKMLHFLKFQKLLTLRTQNPGYAPGIHVVVCILFRLRVEDGALCACYLGILHAANGSRVFK